MSLFAVARFLIYFACRWSPPGQPVAVDVPWNEHGSRLLSEALSTVVRRGHSYELLLAPNPRRLARAMALSTIHGVLTNAAPPDPSLLKLAPWVQVGGATQPGVGSVVLSEGNAMEKMVGHLRAFGHRHIGWASIHAPGPRLSAWRQVMAEHGPPPSAQDIFQYPSETVSKWPTRAWKQALDDFLTTNCLKRRDPLDAIVCDNDGTARLLLAVAEKIGLAVPRDLGVTGVDGRPDVEGEPRLTTVVQNPSLLALGSVKYFEEIISGKRPRGQTITQAPTLRLGDTTSFREPTRRQQMTLWNRTLDLHWQEQDPATSIALKLGLGRAYFLRRFSYLTGMPFPSAIEERRLERAWFLLTHTNRSVQQITLDCGYESTVTFHRQFRRKFGESPGKCRGSGEQPGSGHGAP